MLLSKRPDYDHIARLEAENAATDELGDEIREAYEASRPKRREPFVPPILGRRPALAPTNHFSSAAFAPILIATEDITFAPGAVIPINPGGSVHYLGPAAA